MAGSAIDLGISKGLFGEAPKLGAGMQSLMGSNAARGERVAESGRNAQYANVDLNDADSITKAATDAQKAGDTVKSKEFFALAHTVRNRKFQTMQQEQAVEDQEEKDAQTGRTAQATADLLTKANVANFPRITGLLSEGEITPAAALAAIQQAEARSVVAADAKKEADKEIETQSVLAELQTTYLANHGNGDIAKTIPLGTLAAARALVDAQIDTNPESQRNKELEATKKKAAVQTLWGSIAGMDQAEKKIAAEIVNSNPLFWPPDPETGVPTRQAQPSFEGRSSEYITALTSEVKETSIAHVAAVKNLWKPQTTLSLIAAENLAGEINELLRPSNDNWGPYPGQEEWISVLAQAIPTIQAGMDVTQESATRIVQRLIVNGKGKEGDNVYTMIDLQKNVREMVTGDLVAQLTEQPAEPTPTTTTTTDATTTGGKPPEAYLPDVT
jgi:hypothetical protein